MLYPENLSSEARDIINRIEGGDVQEFAGLDTESDLYKEVFEYFAGTWDEPYKTREDVYWHLFYRYAN